MNAWYATLKRPPLTPPNWVFGPVWTVLYLMIAASLFLFYRNEKEPVPMRINALIGTHIASNLAWTPLFFGRQNPAAALADILLLVATLGALILHFRRKHPVSALLLIPYLVWVTFATYLNTGFYLLNK
ncbi:tryptophan-rich sensory protein [Candidatus Ozemobacteraceae bacterium]|nr:tryptophan-rich sensory protein [Candidatus Ozemobacteraceae bacterium]